MMINLFGPSAQNSCHYIGFHCTRLLLAGHLPSFNSPVHFQRLLTYRIFTLSHLPGQRALMQFPEVIFPQGIDLHICWQLCLHSNRKQFLPQSDILSCIVFLITQDLNCQFTNQLSISKACNTIGSVLPCISLSYSFLISLPLSGDPPVSIVRGFFKGPQRNPLKFQANVYLFFSGERESL